MGSSVSIISQQEHEEPDELQEKLRSKVKANFLGIEIDPSEYLDPRRPFSPPDWALAIRGTPFYAFDDYNYLQGQAGNGKSFTLCIYESVILGAKFGELEYVGNREKPKILHIDTEQSEGNVQLHVRRVYHLAGWEQSSDHSDQFRVLMLRETPSPQQRWAKVMRACVDYKPDFLFVDGMLDVVESMNKEDACNIVISEAGALASIFKLCMIGICHENPSNPKADTKDGPPKPAGHIGSYSQRKGSAGQSTVKTLVGIDATFHVTPKKVRNKDYQGFAFKVRDEIVRIDDHDFQIGIPYWYEEVLDISASEEDKPKIQESKKDKAIRILKSLRWGLNGKRYSDIESDLVAVGVRAKPTINDYITIGLDEGVITKDKVLKRFYLVNNAADIASQTSLEDDNGDPF